MTSCLTVQSDAVLAPLLLKLHFASYFSYEGEVESRNSVSFFPEQSDLVETLHTGNTVSSTAAAPSPVNPHLDI